MLRDSANMFLSYWKQVFVTCQQLPGARTIRQYWLVLHTPNETSHVTLQGADATLKPPQARSHNAVIFKTVADTVLEFAEALNQNQLHSSSLPRFEALSAEQPELDSAALPATASGSQEAPVIPDESQQAQAQPLGNDVTNQVAGVTQAPAAPKEATWPAEQGLPAVPHDHSGTYAQHSYDPGPFGYS